MLYFEDKNNHKNRNWDEMSHRSSRNRISTDIQFSPKGVCWHFLENKVDLAYGIEIVFLVISVEPDAMMAIKIEQVERILHAFFVGFLNSVALERPT